MKRASRVPMPYLSTRQVADILEFRSTEGVRHLIESGMLACARVRTSKDGRSIYWITPREVAEYLAAHDATRIDALKAIRPDVAA